MTSRRLGRDGRASFATRHRRDRAGTGHDDRRRTRAVVVGVVGFVLAIVVINLVARGLDSAVGGSEPGGASGSSYSTGPDGLAAYAQLLSDYGHPVQRQRGSLADATIDPRSTLFVTASDRGFPLEPEEIATIRAIVGRRRTGRARRLARRRSRGDHRYDAHCHRRNCRLPGLRRGAGRVAHRPHRARSRRTTPAPKLPSTSTCSRARVTARCSCPRA